MKQVDWEKLLRDERTHQDAVLAAKGEDYAERCDVLANLKRGAAALGLSPVQVTGVFLQKHYDALMHFIRYGQVASEPVEERITDLHNYLYLLSAVLLELKGGHNERLGQDVPATNV